MNASRFRVERFENADGALAWLASAGAQAAVLVVAILLLRAVLGPRLTPGWRIALWLTVWLRLCVPMAVESRWSLAAAGRAIGSTLTTHVAASPAPAVPPSTVARVTYDLPALGAAAAVAPAPRPLPPRSNAPLLVGMWLAGVVVLCVRQVIAGVRLRRAVGRMRRVEDQAVLALAARCARTLNMRRVPRLVETDRLRSPAVCGILHPTVLLPVGARDALAPDELRFALLHEFAHVRRGDVLLGAVVGLVRAVHWFNPFAWLAAAAFRADRELACDAAVLRAVSPDERRAYGACLLRVVELVSGRPAHAATLGLFGGRRLLRRRIAMSVEFPSRTRRVVHAALGLVVLSLIGAAAALGEPGPTTTTTQAADEKGDAAVAATLARLATQVPELRLDGVSLDDAAKAIARVGGVPVRVDRKALAAAGVEVDAQVVTMRLQDVRLSKALAVAFADLKGRDGSPVRVDYDVAADGAIVMTTVDGLMRGRITRTFGLPRALSPDAYEGVVRLVTETIDPPSWKGNGGIGEIEVRGNRLIVTHMRRRLAEVARLVRQLNDRGPGTTQAATAPTTGPSVLEAKRLPELRFDAVPLTDAIDFLRDTSGASIFVNWKTLEAAGVPRSTPVTIRVKDVSLGTAVRVMLESAGGEKVRLAYAVDDGVISISTQAEIDVGSLVTRVYDIRDLLVEIRDIDPAATKPTDTELATTRAAMLATLKTLLTDTVEPDSWKAKGGALGTIQELGGQLIVTQTPRAHGQIVTILESLRAARALQVNVETRLISLPRDVAPPALRELASGATTRPVMLDDAAAALVLRDIQLGRHGVTTLTAPRLTLFNGQRAEVRVQIPNGMMVRLAERATLSADLRSATVAIDGHFERLAGQPGPTTVDATLAIPSGQQAVLPAMGTDPKGTAILLFVRPTAIVPRQIGEPSSRPAGE